MDQSGVITIMNGTNFQFLQVVAAPAPLQRAEVDPTVTMAFARVQLAHTPKMVNVIVSLGFGV